MGSLPLAPDLALQVVLLGACAGLLAGTVARPRGGPALLLDAVLESLRAPLALASIPLPALLVGEPANWPALLGVLVFTPVFLLTCEARRASGVSAS